MGIVKLLRASELGFHFVRATQSRRKEVRVERLIFGTSCLGYTVGLPASDRPTCYPCPAECIWGRLTLCLIRARRGKRAHPISEREFAQGSRRARAAYQSHCNKGWEVVVS